MIFCFLNITESLISPFNIAFSIDAVLFICVLAVATRQLSGTGI